LIKKYLESIKQDPRYTHLLLFLFDLIDGSDKADIHELSFNDLLTKIQSDIAEIGQEIANYVYKQIVLILKDDSVDLFSFFEHELKPLIPAADDIANDDAVYLSKSSLLGMFHRKLMICYNHSSFSTLNKFLKNIEHYHDEGIVTLQSCHPRQHDDDDDDLKDRAQHQEILNRLKYPYELDEEIYKLCTQSNDNQTAPRGQYNNYNTKLFSIISDSFPELPSTHYFNCIEHMKSGEYLTSLSYLHKYFDFVASSFKINWSNIINNKNKQNKINQKQYQALLQQKRKKMQYSLLCRAMFYAYFGHYNLAIQQITEALQRAQNIGDRTCVASALYLLVEFLSDQSGNINLIKQIYENCIQNTEAIASVHIGSLIGLSKWNLYHISVYRTKSRPWYLWEYFYFANKMIILNNNDKLDLNKYFGEIHSLKGNAWNLYGNQSLSCISYQTFILNHVNHCALNTHLLYTNIANYLQYHCKYGESIEILKQLTSSSDSHNEQLILNQMSLILLLRQAIHCRDLELASIYQTRLAELIPSCRDNFLLYLEMMYLHCQIRFEYDQFMEASRILNTLISLCNQRSLQSLTVPYYLFLSKIHLKCHRDITMVMSYVLKAWSICKSYHFYYWLPECAIFLARLHLQLDNIRKSVQLVQQHLPLILKKHNHLICDAYVILAKCSLHSDHFVGAIQYFHCARIWCLKLMKEDDAFRESCKAKELLQEIYYFLARLYENMGDMVNRDKSAQKLMDLEDAAEDQQ